MAWIIMPYFRGNWHFQRLRNVSMVLKLASSRTRQTPLVRLSPLALHWKCYCYIHVVKIDSHSLVLMLSSHQYLLHFFPLLSFGLITAVTFQMMSRLYFCSLYYSLLAAVTNDHMCCSFNQQSYYLTFLEVRRWNGSSEVKILVSAGPYSLLKL